MYFIMVAYTVNDKSYINDRKVALFTGFHPIIGKTFTVFASSACKMLKKAIAQLYLCWENFCDSSKKPQNFCRLTFVAYGNCILIKNHLFYYIKQRLKYITACVEKAKLQVYR